MDVTRGFFITIDGLSASGKTTVAPLVAALVDGVHLTDDTLPTFPRMRAEVDAADILAARFHWWMMANHIKSETARAVVGEGRTVVVESYFPRTIATYRAMGHDCAPEYPEGVLVPHVPILLEVDERVRQERLRRRAELGTPSFLAPAGGAERGRKLPRVPGVRTAAGRRHRPHASRGGSQHRRYRALVCPHRIEEGNSP
ncbi:AAA family ATPase [Kitasatospora sp. NPDC001225]